MALDTLATLRTAVSSWLARDNLTPYVDDLILAGEKYLVRKVRCHEMEESFSEAMSSGVVAVPSGFQAWKWVAISGAPYRPLKVRTASSLIESYPIRSAAGKPNAIARDAGSFIFGPGPDADYTIVGTYYKRPASILASVDDLFSAHPDLYLFAALAESVLFIKDDKRVVQWIAKRDQTIASVNQEAKDNDASGTMQTVVDFAEG